MFLKSRLRLRFQLSPSPWSGKPKIQYFSIMKVADGSAGALGSESQVVCIGDL